MTKKRKDRKVGCVSKAKQAAVTEELGVAVPTLGEVHARERKGGLDKTSSAAIISHYTEKFLKNKHADRVLLKVLEVSLEDGHPHQAACLKMAMDRIIPAASVAALAGASGGKSAVTINITGIGGTTSPVTIDGENIEDAGWEDV